MPVFRKPLTPTTMKIDSFSPRSVTVLLRNSSKQYHNSGIPGEKRKTAAFPRVFPACLTISRSNVAYHFRHIKKDWDIGVVDFRHRPVVRNVNA